MGILRAVERVCGDMGARWRRVLLFGSRAELTRRGGDIDLLVELARDAAADAFRLRQRMVLALEDALGERKVDVVVDAKDDEPFVQIARAQGVELWIND
jgi:predicted nucleotidyltransferase